MYQANAGKRKSDGGKPKFLGGLAEIHWQDYDQQAHCLAAMQENTINALAKFISYLLSALITGWLLALLLALSASYLFPMVSLTFPQWFVVAMTLRLISAK